MLVYYFFTFIVNNHYLLFQVSSAHNSVTVQKQTHIHMNFFYHKDLGNHLLQQSPLVVKHCIYTHRVSQGKCARLWENDPRVKIHRYNQKHLYPKFNGYGDDGEKSLKV